MAKHRRGARRRTPRHLPVRVVAREDGSAALEVGGVVQSLYWPPEAPPSAGTLFAVGYWELMLPSECPQRALLLGLGGGTVAWLLARRCPGVAILGIEADALVLATARAEMALDAVPGLRVIEGDAFAWVAQASLPDGPRFDFIAVDLFEAGSLVAGTLATPFLRQLVALVAPGGQVAFNLILTRRLDEQRHRLSRVFAILRERRHVGNIVMLARPLSAPDAPPASPHDVGANAPAPHPGSA